MQVSSFACGSLFDYLQAGLTLLLGHGDSSYDY
jgi:hypothetical protein